MSKASASLSAPTVRRGPDAAAPRAFRPLRPSRPTAAAPASPRENDVRRVTDLLRRVKLAPPADFAARLRAARSPAEAAALVDEQVRRAVRANRAAARTALAEECRALQDRMSPDCVPLIRQARRERAAHAEARIGAGLKPMTAEEERELRAARLRALRARRTARRGQ